MTEYHLVYAKKNDEYLILATASNNVFQVIYRREMNDEDFKGEAIRQFNLFVSKRRIGECEIVMTELIY